MKDCIFCDRMKNSKFKNIIIENKKAIAIFEGYFREGQLYGNIKRS